MMSFVTRTLGEICDEVDGIVQTGPFGSQLHRSDYRDEGTPVVMPKDLVEGKVSVESIARIGQEDVSRLSRHKLKKGDIVYARRGDIGRRALITGREAGWMCGTGCMRISLADSVVHPVFLHYYLGQPDIVTWIYNQAIGATMPNLNTSIVRSIPITYPPLPTQRKITAILSAYDDLIENNTRRIALLEQTAQLLYREWFVHFRFPGHESVPLVESELGPIPQKWEVVKVKSIVKRLKGGTHYKKNGVVETGRVPVIDQSQDTILGFHNNEPDHKATLESPIIIFGDHTCKMQLMVKPFSLGPNVVPFVSKDNIPVTYLYYLVNSLVETQEYKRHWTELTNKVVAIAPNTYAERFAEFAKPIFGQTDILVRRNMVLRQTRDLLLPRLISGQLDVSELEINGVRQE